MRAFFVLYKVGLAGCITTYLGGIGKQCNAKSVVADKPCLHVDVQMELSEER